MSDTIITGLMGLAGGFIAFPAPVRYKLEAQTLTLYVPPIPYPAENRYTLVIC